MPGGKRTKKAVTYTERDDDADDDDDFITKVDNSKKIRDTKMKDSRIETKSSTRQAPRKREEKLSKTEQDQLELALQLSKETIQSNEVSIELPVIIDEKKSTNRLSTILNNEERTIVEDEYNENLLPKSKRMKRNEEKIEEELNNDEEEENVQESSNEEEEEKPVLSKKSIDQKERTKKNMEIPTVSNIDLNSTRSTTRAQQKSSIPSSEPTTKKSNIPTGFPTSKIIIPSLQASRVGLSRKSSAIKPLHPNLNQRIVHE